MCPALLLIAQAPDVAPLGGGAGWAGAGLLGLVLCWLLLKHLPDKDRQMRDLIDVKDKQISEVNRAADARLDAQQKTFTETLTSMGATFKSESEANRETFQGEQRAERVACTKQFETLATAIGKGHETTIAAVKTMTDQIASHNARAREHDKRDDENRAVIQKALEERLKALREAEERNRQDRDRGAG